MLLASNKYHDRFRNTKHAFEELRQYGVKEYYRGVSTVVLRNGPSSVLFFGLRDPLRKVFDGWRCFRV